MLELNAEEDKTLLDDVGLAKKLARKTDSYLMENGHKITKLPDGFPIKTRSIYLLREGSLCLSPIRQKELCDFLGVDPPKYLF